jgi:hypothetical protein
MDLSGQLYAPAALPYRITTKVPTVQMYNTHPYNGTTMNYFCETKESQPSPITNHQVAKPCKTEVLLAKSVPDDALKMSVSCSTVTTNQLSGSVLSNDASASAAYWK